MPEAFLDGHRSRFLLTAAVAVAFLGTCSGETLRPPTGLVNGGACKVANDCQSRFCVDDVCCESACDGTCQSCASSGSEGTCLAADVGTDPRDQCQDEGATNCGQDGTCDGAGQCRRYPVGTVCGDGTCAGSTLTAASRCGDASGCTPAQPQTCAPYICGATAMCLTACTKDMDCTAGVCLAGSCGKKPIGADCAAATDCNSGFCEQGVCCNVSCSTSCVSCALAGSVGTCTPIPTGQDPLNQCTAGTPMSCGLDGSCNGAGACRFFGTTTVCSAAMCTGSTRTPPGTCDGAGVCKMPTMSCGNYSCGTTGACRTTCGTTADCATPSVCNGGSCGGLKGEYFDNVDFTSLLLTRTDPTIDFAWGNGAPPGAAAVGADMFSVRWTGKITPRYSETYTFHLASDDGDRLFVNNMMIINHFSVHASMPEDTGTIALMANQAYDIKVEYYENTMTAEIHLSWSSASQAREIVPTSRLSPAP